MIHATAEAGIGFQINGAHLRLILEVVTYPCGTVIGGVIINHRQPIFFIPAIWQQGIETGLGGGGKFAVAEQKNVDIGLVHAWMVCLGLVVWAPITLEMRSVPVSYGNLNSLIIALPYFIPVARK